MNGKYPLTGIGILESDARKWYDAEQYWNCEPEDLKKIQFGSNKPAKSWHTRRS